MDGMEKVAALAVAGALCAVVVKKQTREIGLVLALAAGTILLTMTLSAGEDVLGLMERLRETAGLSPAVLAPVIKTVGIAILTRVAAEVCKDAGEGALASFTELAGAVLALCTAVPLLQAVLDTVSGLL